MNSFGNAYLCTDLHYLCKYFLYLSAVNVTPTIKVLVIEAQSLFMLKCIWQKQIEKGTGMLHALWKRRRPF